MMAGMAEGFGTWSGVGIPIPPTTPTSSITRSCYEGQTGWCGPYTTGTSRVFLPARGGWSGSPAAGLSVLSNDIDQWGRDVFLARAAGSP